MSATVKIERDIYNAEVEVTVTTVECADCNKALSFDLESNRDNELVVTVEACPACIKSAVADATAQAADSDAANMRQGDPS